MAWLIGLGDVHPVLGQAGAPHDINQSQVGINGTPCSYASIGAAITAASSGDTIYIPSGHTYNEVLGSISKDLTLTAATSDCTAVDASSGATTTRIDGGGNDGGTWGGLVTIDPNVTVTFAHLTLEDATASHGGIAYVDSGGRMILDDAVVRQGTATNTGGGVRIYIDAALELHNGSAIYDNAVTNASSGGGGVAVYQGAMTMTQNSAVGSAGIGNTSAGDGGGILLHSSNLYADNAYIQQNQAVDNGGGIMAFGESVIDLYGMTTIGGPNQTLSNTATLGGGVYVAGPTAGIVLHETSWIEGNVASDDGGGVYAAADAYVTLRENAAIVGNSAFSSGGGAYLTGEDTRLNMIYGLTRIQGNDAHGAVVGDGGGGVYLDRGASLYGDVAWIISNTTTLLGGGILVGHDAVPTQTSVILLNGSLLGYNTANIGGGLHVDDDDGSIIVSGSQLESNEAATTGGGIRLYRDSTIEVMSGSTISGNTAGRWGGGLAMYTGTVILDDVSIMYNTASADDGGGILMSRGVLTATDSEIDFNEAGGDGGGIFHGSGRLHLGSVDKDSSLSVNSATRGGGLYDISGELVTISPDATTTFHLNTNYASDSGGGAYITGTTLLDIGGDLVISSNTAANDGGAFYIDNSLVALDNGDAYRVQLGAGNEAQSGNGGAIYAEGSLIGLDNVDVGYFGGFGNTAGNDGGGIYIDSSYLVLEDTRMFYNSAGGDGGGIAMVNNSQLVMDTSYGLVDEDCDPMSLPANAYCSEIRENTADGWGAGIYVYQSAAEIVDTAFLDNVGLSSNASPGAAIEVSYGSVEVTNGLFSGHGTNDNNAVHVYTDGRYTSRQSTYAGNQDTPLYAVDSSAITLTNNIIWDNALSAYYQSAVTITATCNDTQLPLGGSTNINVDPQFITTTRGAYRLGSDSPAVDACTGTVDHDLDHTTRPINADAISSSTEYDMGAFERRARVFLPIILRNVP